MLITRAGSGSASNVIRSLRLVTTDVYVVGCHEDPFVLKKSTADANYLIAATGHPSYAASLRSVLEREKVDLVVPVTDADVAAISQIRRLIPTRVFLPKPRTLDMCSDKLRLAIRLRKRGVAVPISRAVSGLESLPRVFDSLPRGGRAWCRARRGAGSVAAAPVASADDARAWIKLWCGARGLKPRDFMIAEYLPGRDFACQSLWRNGQLLLIKTTERLAYVDGGARLSGTSSVASVHKTVMDERLLSGATQAVLAVDSTATGAFSLDFKENDDGEPCVTEINAGRLLSGTTIFDEVGRHNMSFVYVRVGAGYPVGIRDVYDSPEGHYVVRDLDTLPNVFGSTELLAGWIDAR